MEEEILFITGNSNKLREAQEITGLKIVAKEIELPEIQSMDVAEVAKAKAAEAFRLIGKPVIVDDTALSIEALNGLPGTFITWFLKILGLEGILGLISRKKNRKATVSTCVAYADKNGVRTFLGEVKGEVASSIRGESNFGYDPIFIPDGYTQTFAEMGSEEKNRISMRKIAFTKFKEWMGSRD